MPAPPIHELSEDVLEELYDDGAIDRGAGYALEDRVKIIESKPGKIRAVCRGSGRATYLVRIRWHDAGGGIYLDDECSCPLGGQCKHCVATLIVARRGAQVARLDDRRGPPGPRDPFATVAPPATDWRKELDGLAATDEPIEVATQLALQFNVRRIPSRFPGQQPAVVSVRPMRLGKSGRWVKTDATWRDLVSTYLPPYAPLAQADPVQRGALQALAASARIGPYSTGPDPTLDRFGPNFWSHLRQAVDAGAVLLGDPAALQVRLERQPARVHVDLAAGAHGSVSLAAELRVGGAPVTSLGDEVQLLGTPPSGLWAATPGLLRLVEFDAPIHRTVARLLGGPPLTVPAGDVDDLIDSYVPALAQHAEVGSADGTVSIEGPAFERLALLVARTGPTAASLYWAVRYRRGERTADHPLFARPVASRDLDAEDAALDELRLPLDLLPAIADDAGLPADLHVTGEAAIVLLTEVVPWLEAQGQVAVELRSDLPPLRAPTEDPVISVAVRDAAPSRDGNDWFDLDVTVTVDGEDVEFVPLFAALHRGDPFLILPSGTYLRLDRPEFAKLRELLDEANGLAEPDGDATARVNRFQAGWWDELVELGVVAEQSERWERSVAQLRDLQAPQPLPAPAALEASLRPYQQEGFEWLAFLHANGLGGILADDMGLGKTVQTLALCLHVHERAPDARFLVVAPTSVVENWAREAQRFAPGLPVRTIHETQARRGTTLAEEVAGHRLVVTSYALFRLEFDQYAALPWELLLLDEAQYVKNHQGKTHQCARRLPAATKVAITGTPLENTLMDLWSLLSISAPGLYPDPKRFSDTYRKPIENGDAPELLATLKRRIAPLMRRRTKDAVLTELPPKIEQTIEVELSAKHARIYGTQLQRQRQKVLGLVGDVTKHRFEILKSLTILRQMALDPALVDDEHEGVGSAKLDRLVDDLTQVLAEGHRALVFSQFTRYLARVRERLDAAGIDHAYLDGRTRQREAAISRFKDGDVPVFVISLKAGGVGLNLTEADYCFVLDPWWNPATETQAVDRAHRIGQTNPVVVYRYVSVDTIEEKVMELKGRKARLFDQVVGDEAALAGALGEDDIRALLDLA
ncbi:MAG: DEAD/DEAH box helicase [Acidimicrobiales bacterium]